MKRKPLSAGDWAIAALFGATIIVVAAQVVWRYVFNNSLVWTEELSRYLFVWMTFLGAALAIKEGTHVRVTLLLDRLPRPLARSLNLAHLALIIVFLGFLTFVGFQWVNLNAGTLTPALRVPLNFALYASLPVASLLGVWFGIRKATAIWRTKSREESQSEGK